jgi:membrane protease YdiL (CAAX protease family)
VNDGADGARGSGRLLAWAALVGASALLIVGVKLVYDVPDDVRYRYATVLFAVVVSALQLTAVLRIAGPTDRRETFALRQPSWSYKCMALVAVLIVVGMLVLLAFFPFLQQGEAEGDGAAWDRDRALPFVLNALVLVVLSPVLEELMFRGLGFTLFERYGRGTAIALPGSPSGSFTGSSSNFPR